MSLALAWTTCPDRDRSEDPARPITVIHGPRSALTPRHCTATLGVTIGALFYLLSLGLVGAATVGAFFGVGLMTLISAPYDRTSPAAKTPLPRSIAAAVFPDSDFAQNPPAQAALMAETSGTARGSVREFATRETPGSAAGSAQSALKPPVVRSTARKAKRAPPPLTGPVTARDGTLTPPMQPGLETLTPRTQTAPPLRSTGREATLTPPPGD
jgi:hypothetical protein